MAAVIASLAGALIVAGVAYDIARLITPDEPRRPPRRPACVGGVPRRRRPNGGWARACTTASARPPTSDA